MINKIPREEFPNPQFQRLHWENLNGEWEFEQDPNVSGLAKNYFKKEHFSKKIMVPFCPESSLSGIGDTDFQTCVWYRRDFISHAQDGERTILHFGAVDYEASIYVNGVFVYKHRGGYSSFSCDITDYLTKETNSICVMALDEDRNPLQGHGKQSRKYESWRCFYTRVTGIWQTVWVEYVPKDHIVSFQMDTNTEQGILFLKVNVVGQNDLYVSCQYEGKDMGEVSISCHENIQTISIPLKEKHLWELGKGGLYDITFQYGKDKVKSYFGLRSIALIGNKFYLNNKVVFQRLILDQGYYPDGIYTAASKELLEKDIVLSMKLGYNGARLHQKVFEPLYLYYCDLHGYMVWEEYGNWGYDISNIGILPNFIEDWIQVMQRDYNHPSIIGWCPFNETQDYENRKQDDAILKIAYEVTKAIDSTRLCIDTSGFYHVITDIYDMHDYTQDPKIFEKMYGKHTIHELFDEYKKHHTSTCKYGLNCNDGAPFFLSEYGGIKWNPNAMNEQAWGYGNAPKTEEEFRDRYVQLTSILLDNPMIMGFCYTQLTDVEQETNGLYDYNRKPKFKNMDFMKEVNGKIAAIEK